MRMLSLLIALQLMSCASIGPYSHGVAGTKGPGWEQVKVTMLLEYSDCVGDKRDFNSADEIYEYIKNCKDV